MPKQKINIVLTGGHAATTGLAVVEEIVKQKKPWKLYWIGDENKEFLVKKGVVFEYIVSGKIYKWLNIESIKSFVKIPFGFLHAFYILMKIRPRVILSFGGYAGVPVVFAGKLFGSKIIIHEQVAGAGLGNRITSKIADTVTVARSESVKYFNCKKTKKVGNPLTAEIIKITPKKNLSKLPVILVTGGSRGARPVNTMVGLILDILLNDYRVIHLTGKLDYKKYVVFRKRLTKKKKVRYEVFSKVDPDRMAGLYKRADIVLGRSGANTVAEVIYTGRPAVFIPIQWSLMDEQRKNAQFAKKLGLAEIIEQTASSSELAAVVDKVRRNWNGMAKGQRDFDKFAVGLLVDAVEEAV